MQLNQASFNILYLWYVFYESRIYVMCLNFLSQLVSLFQLDSLMKLSVSRTEDVARLNDCIIHCVLLWCINSFRHNLQCSQHHSVTIKIQKVSASEKKKYFKVSPTDWKNPTVQDKQVTETRRASGKRRISFRFFNPFCVQNVYWLKYKMLHHGWVRFIHNSVCT